MQRRDEEPSLLFFSWDSIFQGMVYHHRKVIKYLLKDILHSFKKFFKNQLWLVWLSWLEVISQSKRLPVQFLVRAHAWVAGSIPGQGVCQRHSINVSLSHQRFSPSLSLFPPSPSKNKENLLNNNLKIQYKKKIGIRENHVHFSTLYSNTSCDTAW